MILNFLCKVGIHIDKYHRRKEIDIKQAASSFEMLHLWLGPVIIETCCCNCNKVLDTEEDWDS